MFPPVTALSPPNNYSQDKPIVQELVKYILARSQSSPSLNQKLKELLSSSAPSHTGLILTERLINVPAEIVPPMYKMLLEEISWAIEEVRLLCSCSH